MSWSRKREGTPSAQLNPAEEAFKRAQAAVGYDHFRLGRYEESAEDFARALELRPSDPYMVIWRYLALARQEQPLSSGDIINQRTLSYGSQPEVSAITDFRGPPSDT